MKTAREWLEVLGGFRSVTWKEFRAFAQQRRNTLVQIIITDVPRTQEESLIRERAIGQASMLLSLLDEFESYANSQYEQQKSDEYSKQTSQSDPSL